VNERNKYVAELWDGVNLRCTFRKCVDRRLFDLWDELVNLVTTMEMSEEEDALIWQY
jgi:hypothetical protein